MVIFKNYLFIYCILLFVRSVYFSVLGHNSEDCGLSQSEECGLLWVTAQSPAV